MTTLIVYHKQATSARTRFLRGPRGCLLSAETVAGTTTHPGSALLQVAEELGISPTVLELDTDFRETDSACGSVYLARVTSIDPPKITSPGDYRFISLMDARDLPATELDLLGAAYRAVLGG